MRDLDLRAEVKRTLADRYLGDTQTRIVEEMGVWSGSVRIDIAVINGELVGYELKSDRDTLRRLPLQIEIYSRVFDRIVLVVAKRHEEAARELVPPWWGITMAEEQDGRVSLAAVKPPERNPSPDPYLVAQLLWKNEALAVLETFDLARGWRQRRVKNIHMRLAAEIPFSDLANYVREALKRRSGWLA